MNSFLVPTLVTHITDSYRLLNDQKRLCHNVSLDVLHQCKQSIFAIHRGDIETAVKILDGVDAHVRELATFPVTKGPVASAFEEYVEAVFLLRGVQGKRIEELQYDFITVDAYIGGLSDVVGEIVRIATKTATNRDLKELQRLHAISEEIMTVLYGLDLTGPLRQKFDQAKSHMRKLEHIVYEVSLRV